MKSGSIVHSEQKMKFELILDNLKMSDIKQSQSSNIVEHKVEPIKNKEEKLEDNVLLDALKIK